METGTGEGKEEVGGLSVMWQTPSDTTNRGEKTAHDRNVHLMRYEEGSSYWEQHEGIQTSWHSKRRERRKGSEK
jgi:hypothetical protein